jgi:deferrochelatase/peroxidase EfeB
MCAAPAQRLRLADRGPGYSYRPDDTPPSIFGAHQAGIASAQLDHLELAAFDLTGDLRDLLVRWSAQAERLMRENGVTVTFGLGARPFEGTSLEGQRPAALRDLPAFEGDALDPAWSGGDLCLLVSAGRGEDAAEALRHLEREGAGAARTRWRQRGFTERGHEGARRDLLGFRDGTMNLRRGRDLDRHVWVTGRDRNWMVGGTYLVVRRIRIDLSAWRRLPLEHQQRVVGRQKHSGAPLGGRREFDPLPLEREGPDGPVVPLDAHARLAAPRSNEGIAMLRRSYSFRDGPADAGLLFLAYQQDPRRQFVPVQRRLASGDALSRFTTHVGSAVFAIPPGASPGGFVGNRLLGG